MSLNFSFQNNHLRYTEQKQQHLHQHQVRQSRRHNYQVRTATQLPHARSQRTDHEWYRMAPSSYSAAFNNHLAQFRNNRKLISIKNIRFGRSKRSFETECSARLTTTPSFEFAWPPPTAVGFTHRGEVFLCFQNRPACNQSFEELRG